MGKNLLHKNHKSGGGCTSKCKKNKLRNKPQTCKKKMKSEFP